MQTGSKRDERESPAAKQPTPNSKKASQTKSTSNHAGSRSSQSTAEDDDDDHHQGGVDEKGEATTIPLGQRRDLSSSAALLASRHSPLATMFFYLDNNPYVSRTHLSLSPPCSALGSGSDP